MINKKSLKRYMVNKRPFKRPILNKRPLKVRNKEITLEEAHIPKNYKISINYVHIKEKWDQNKVAINNIFVFQVALDIIRNYEDPKPQNVEKC